MAVIFRDPAPSPPPCPPGLLPEIGSSLNCTDAQSRACPPFLALPRLGTHPFPPRYPDCHLLSSARSCWPCDLRRGSFCPRPLTAHPTWPSWGSRRQLGPCPLCVLCLPRSVLRVPCRGSSSPLLSLRLSFQVPLPQTPPLFAHPTAWAPSTAYDWKLGPQLHSASAREWLGGTQVLDSHALWTSVLLTLQPRTDQVLSRLPSPELQLAHQHKRRVGQGAGDGLGLWFSCFIS